MHAFVVTPYFSIHQKSLTQRQAGLLLPSQFNRVQLPIHAETLMVVFNPAEVSYQHLLFEFFRIHNPTMANRQGNDIGSQYRSAIFYTNEAQRKIALEVIATVDTSNEWQAPVVTEVTAFKAFYPAEEKHQQYLMKVPEGYTCHFRRSFKLGEP
ncbi:MAG: peptide-methionine (S)-S-oxide reductase [Methylophilaceae bacterium]|nr:peptide-methionine (S)-S-oxide reductase [Methylophilaceae bacterium]